MDIQLTANEARVIGCLMEKSVITPDQYPLSLNALVNACNQKSSREPVLSLEQGVVERTVKDLIAKRARDDSGVRQPRREVSAAASATRTSRRSSSRRPSSPSSACCCCAARRRRASSKRTAADCTNSRTPAEVGRDARVAADARRRAVRRAATARAAAQGSRVRALVRRADRVGALGSARRGRRRSAAPRDRARSPRSKRASRSSSKSSPRCKQALGVAQT